jgi:hypothetical protein
VSERGNLAANLQFFRSAIFEPAVAPRIGVEPPHVVTSDFGAIEAAGWARLGTEIGYFDAREAQKLVSSSEAIPEAWANLTGMEALRRGGYLSELFRGKGGRPLLNRELFSAGMWISPAIRALLQNTFQTFLLLAAEYELVATSSYFLEAIGWETDEAWNDGIRSDKPSIGEGSIASGFSNVLHYMEDVRSTTFFALSGISELGRTRQSGSPERRIFRHYFEAARTIQFSSFNLNKLNVVERYFLLAGEFASLAKDDTPEWFDARSHVFERLEQLISFAAGPSIRDFRPRLWDEFTKGIDARTLERRGRVPPRQAY